MSQLVGAVEVRPYIVHLCQLLDFLYQCQQIVVLLAELSLRIVLRCIWDDRHAVFRRHHKTKRLGVEQNRPFDVSSFESCDILHEYSDFFVLVLKQVTCISEESMLKNLPIWVYYLQQLFSIDGISCCEDYRFDLRLVIG